MFIITFLITQDLILTKLEDITNLCQSPNKSLIFYRGFIYSYDCWLINGYSQTNIRINQIQFTQIQQMFWNSNGIQSDNSFCIYRVSNSQLQVKIYDLLYQTSKEVEIDGGNSHFWFNKRNLVEFLEDISIHYFLVFNFKSQFLIKIFEKILMFPLKYFQIFKMECKQMPFQYNFLYKTVKQILRTSESYDIFFFYILDNKNQTSFYYISNKDLLSIFLDEKPQLIKANVYTQKMNRCLYQINIIERSLLQNLIFCLDENDEFEDIQSFQTRNLVATSKKNNYVIIDNLITQILPRTQIYLFQNKNDHYLQKYLIIQDFSERFQNQANVPVFNNCQSFSDEQDKILSYVDPKTINEQQVQYIYEIKYQYEQSIQKIFEQSTSTNLFLFLNSNLIYFYQTNDIDNIYSYFQFLPQTIQIQLDVNRLTIKILILQSVGSFLLSLLFSVLIQRRSKKRLEVIARTEDLIFKKILHISKQEFQKKYELDYRESIGSGSFGQVYKVKNKYKDIIKNTDILQSMPDYYACKQIHSSVNGESQSSQIYHEIEILEKLKKYDNVIKLQNYIIEERSTYIVLELADSTLQELINNKQLNQEKFLLEDIIRFLQQIGKTLAIIYTEEGIAHRDIKPSNILIKEGNYYLSDFGCAEKLFESKEARNNQVMGTLKWIAPELRELKKNEGINFFKSDIFSLGMVLIYMLTLSDISSVNSDEFSKNQKLRIMRNQCKDIPSDIILLITKMLETDPDNRPDSAILMKAIEDIENNQK